MDKNYITTKGSLFVTDPEFNSFTYPPLKLDVLPGEYVIKTYIL